MLLKISELVLSLFVSYIGTLELVFTAKYLYHWLNRHGEKNSRSIEEIQEYILSELTDADFKEEQTENLELANEDPIHEKRLINVSSSRSSVDRAKNVQKDDNVPEENVNVNKGSNVHLNLSDPGQISRPLTPGVVDELKENDNGTGALQPYEEHFESESKEAMKTYHSDVFISQTEIKEKSAENGISTAEINLYNNFSFEEKHQSNENFLNEKPSVYTQKSDNTIAILDVHEKKIYDPTEKQAESDYVENFNNFNEGNELFDSEKHEHQEKKSPEVEAVPNRRDSLIFSGEYTKAMSKDWHSTHFCCWQCDESLTGQRYVIRDDHPYCIKCYENVFANTCEECNTIIGIDSKDLSYKEKHWHEGCFLCNNCRISLVDKQFGAKAEKIYCGNCYDAQFASRCDGCGEVFRAGTKKMEYKARQWHEKCFCCCVCKTPIGTKSFIPREQEIYCAMCYEEKFATRCIKCNKVITSGGVTYKNDPWHRECFTCTNCSCTLAGQRFTSRDDKPYCAECFGELFAKRCTACTKPITGIGGTRFISFEDRHWHHDCFICASCQTSLVGRGFITDGPDIICPECAKQKMM